MGWYNQAAVSNGTLCNIAGGCTLNVRNSTFDGNRGYWASALYIDARQSAVNLAASTFTHNMAQVCNPLVLLGNSLANWQGKTSQGHEIA